MGDVDKIARFLYLYVVLSMGILGAAVWVYSCRYSWYVSATAWESLDRQVIEMDAPHVAKAAAWREGLRRIRTPRAGLADVGVGLMALSASLGLLYGFGFRPGRTAHTPTHWFRMVLMSWGIVAGAWALSAVFWLYRLQRGDFPSWAEAAPAPLINNAIRAVLAAAASAAIWFVLSPIMVYPAPLYIWPAGMRVWNVTLALFCGAGVLLALVLAGMGVWFGAAHVVLSATGGAWALLCVRAGILAYLSVPEEE